MSSSSSLSSKVPTTLSWSIIVSWYSDCQRPAWPRLSGLGCAEVHVGGVEPHEERCVGLVLTVNEAERRFKELVVGRFHALLGQRPGVFDATVSPAVDHSSGTESLPEVGEVVGRWVVCQLRLLFGVQVVEVAEELVEAVVGRQELVLVTEVVLAELAGGVAERLQ